MRHNCAFTHHALRVFSALRSIPPDRSSASVCQLEPAAPFSSLTNPLMASEVLEPRFALRLLTHCTSAMSKQCLPACATCSFTYIFPCAALFPWDSSSSFSCCLIIKVASFLLRLNSMPNSAMSSVSTGCPCYNYLTNSCTTP